MFKKCFITVLFAVLFFIPSTTAFALTTLQTVDFETPTGYTASPAESNTNLSNPDYWIRTNGTTPVIYASVPFTTSDGSYFFAAEDLDHDSGATVYSLTCDPVSVIGQTNLKIMLLAGGRGDGSTKEGEEYLKVQYQMDGGGYTTLAQFLGNGSYYTEDENADGIPDGFDLVEVMQDFSFDVPVTGSTLQVRILAYNGGGEEFAFDNIRVVSQTVLNPPSVTTVGVRGITTNSATIDANVTSDGGTSVTDRGIVYSTTDMTPTIAEGATQVSNGNNTGSFTQIISSFTPYTTYYYNAYAINSEGTSYGTAGSFTTAQTVISTVDFEIDGAGYTATTGTPVTLDGDYWTRTDGVSGNVSFTYPFTNIQETCFFAGEDVVGYLPAYVTTSTVNVTGYIDLQINLLLGAKDDTGSKEIDDKVRIEYSIDGGAFTLLGQFLGDPDEVPTTLDFFKEDIDLDGVFDENGIELRYDLQSFTYDISVTGNSLQLRISVENGSGEEVAFDNIQFMGTSTIPDIPVNIAISNDGSEVTVSWDEVTGATSYKVYSSTDPYTGFNAVSTGSYGETSWTGPFDGNKLFYYVVAVN